MVKPMAMEENQIKRVQPQSIEAEQTVIGCMMLDNECIPTMDSLISGDDFYHRQYGIIFDTIVEIYNENRPVDVLNLKERLTQKNVPPEVSSLEYLGDLVAAVPILTNAKYYAEIVYEKSVLRQLIHAGEDIANECYAGKDRLETILADSEKKIFDVLSLQKNVEFRPISEITLNAVEKIYQASMTKNPVTGIPTGFKDLDLMLTGLHPAELILLAARPSMGKTALVLNILQNVVLKNNYGAAIFSLEMPSEALVNRLLSMNSYVDAQNVRTGQLSDHDWDMLMESADLVGKSKLIIDDTPGISVAEMRSKCRKYKLDHPLDLIIIDYLQLMSGSGRRGNDNRQQEISEISRSLKALAREMNAPVIALSQLSRGPEQRTDHRPVLSDLRESGAIEQDADVVMFIYRDEYYNKDSSAKNVAELIVAKQRNGPVGTVEVAWLPQYGKFANLEKPRDGQ